jgi:RHS repeat-associated protein
MEIVNGTEITYLYAQGQPFALHKKNVDESTCINYLHLDYQGSVMAITDQSGTLLEERNYDVWGRPRTANTLAYVLPNPFGNGSAVKRGYTFHEHLEEFNLINMNGRVYDPVLARFLNADPLLQDNTDGQNYNRYSYVLNNPTKYTDPSGYAYNGFKASNDDIGASSTSSISDATAKIEEDYKGSKARDASSDEKFGSGGSDPGVNDPVDGDPTKPQTSGTDKLKDVYKKNGLMIPCSLYNYKNSEIDGKLTEDLNYILNGKYGNPLSRLGEVYARDWRESSTSDKVNFAMTPLFFFRIGKLTSKIGDAHKTKDVLQSASGGKNMFQKLVGKNPDVLFKNGKIFFTPAKSSPFYGKKPWDTGLNIKDYFH